MTTEVPERISDVEDEEKESGEDTTDTPRQQICKKKWRGYVFCVLYLYSVGVQIFWYMHGTDTALSKLIWSKLE